MEYVQFHSALRVKYKIDLIGWRGPPFGCISKAANKVGELEELLGREMIRIEAGCNNGVVGQLQIALDHTPA